MCSMFLPLTVLTSSPNDNSLEILSLHRITACENSWAHLISLLERKLNLCNNILKNCPFQNC